MRRVLAVICLVLGVGSVVSGVVQASAGSMPPERLAAAVVGGALLIGLGWWVDRPPGR
ncbi:MAG TPA: hypothetical protein VM597_34015 [Gemmataceae bacterium]|jgi:hypothetical protein|nr:hypothetical protein [Gemmataceae bacterium]